MFSIPVMEHQNKMSSLFYHNGHKVLRKGLKDLDSALRTSVVYPACGRQVSVLCVLLSPQNLNSIINLPIYNMKHIGT